MGDHYYTSKPRAAHDEKEMEVELRGKTYRFVTDAGVFSKGRIDFGTRLLIETMSFAEDADVLDIGCGYGPLGICAADIAGRGNVFLTDVNERAVQLAQQNVRINDIDNADVFLGNLYEPVREKGPFDVILTNPPIRAGKDVVHRIFTEGYALLKPGGMMWVVIQKKQGADSALRKLADTGFDVRVESKKKGYRIFCATKPAG